MIIAVFEAEEESFVRCGFAISEPVEDIIVAEQFDVWSE
jgi:hypothetical protein